MKVRVAMVHSMLSSALAVFSLAVAARSAAQTCASVYDFTAIPGYYPYTNTDGSSPQAGLVLSGSTFYGTTTSGGVSGQGTIFKVNRDGGGFANLHSFSVSSGSGTNTDGCSPQAALILSSNFLYGSANLGGTLGNGTLFRINMDGSGFATIHNFTGADGRYLTAGLVLSGNTLYGTAFGGGNSDNGTLFKLNTDGSSFTVLHHFTIADSAGRNSDGANPQGSLILSGDTLYGTANNGGSAHSGTVFAVKTDGTGFTVLHTFTPLSANPWTNSDGAHPETGLLLSGDTLYGTARDGGGSGYGTLFKLGTNGAGFATLHQFAGSPGDGANPNAALILASNTLYGTAAFGGNSGAGTAFKINTDGSDFTTLHHFTGISTYSSPNSDGAFPTGPLISSDNTLYGTAACGGKSGSGAVLAISLLSTRLAIMPSGANVTLFWPANDASFTLQSTTDLASPASWTAVPQAPVVVNGQNSVTLPVSGTKRFFRLIH